jgi:integrase
LPKLTVKEIRAAKPARRPYKRWDEGGLYLFILPTGTRSWRLRYGLEGKRKVLVLGQYPELSLTDARERRNEIKAQLRQGKDPAAERQVRKLVNTNGTSFQAMARDWLSRNKARWRQGYAQEVSASLEAEVYPQFGRLHVDQITPPMVLALIREIEDRAAVTVARRVRQRMAKVFGHAMATGIGHNNPAAIIKDALTHQPQDQQPAITTLPELAAMLRKVEARNMYPVTKLGLRLLALTVVRPNELRFAGWAEFEDLDGAAPIWRIPETRMKTKAEHVVPLAPAAVEVIRAMRMLTGRAPFVFANKSHAQRPMSQPVLSQVLRASGFADRHVPHGFRSSFATIMNNRHPEIPNVIDACLAHRIPGIPGICNRSKYLDHRRAIMEEWASLILDGAPDAETLLLGRRRN